MQLILATALVVAIKAVVHEGTAEAAKVLATDSAKAMLAQTLSAAPTAAAVRVVVDSRSSQHSSARKATPRCPRCR